MTFSLLLDSLERPGVLTPLGRVTSTKRLSDSDAWICHFHVARSLSFLFHVVIGQCVTCDCFTESSSGAFVSLVWSVLLRGRVLIVLLNKPFGNRQSGVVITVFAVEGNWSLFKIQQTSVPPEPLLDPPERHRCRHP